jgi:hypothetical protein
MRKAVTVVHAQIFRTRSRKASRRPVRFPLLPLLDPEAARITMCLPASVAARPGPAQPRLALEAPGAQTIPSAFSPEYRI